MPPSDLPERAARLRAISELAVAISRQPAPDDVHRAAFDAIDRALGSSRAAILSFDRRGTTSAVAWRGFTATDLQSLDGPGLWPEGRDLDPVVVGPAACEDGLAAYAAFLRAQRLEHLALIPLAVAGRPIGALAVFPEGGWTETLREAADPIAALVALALHTKERRTRETPVNGLLAPDAAFRAMLEGAPDAIVVMDHEDRIVVVNGQAERLFGYTRHEIVGAPVEMLLPDGRRGRHPGHRAGYRQAPRTGRMGGEREDLQGRRKDGSEFPAEIDVSPLWTAGGMMVTTVVRDVTERRQAEAQRAELARQQLLRENAERSSERWAFLARVGELLSSSIDYEQTLRAVAELAVPRHADCCILYLVAADGGIRRAAMAHWQPGWEPLLRELERDYPVTWDSPNPFVAALITGRPVVAEVSDAMIEQATAGRPRYSELVRQLNARSIISVPFKTGAQVAGALTWMRMPSSAPYTGEELLLAEEVARRAGLAVEHARLFAEAQEANRIKDNFLATLSHELRTPLNAIIGWAQVLLEHEAEAEPQRHGLEVVLRNARAQEQIVSDVLDVSRIVSGKIRLDAAATDVVEVVDAAVEATRLPADARHVEVRFVRPSQPVIIAGDARRLQQVVWNLLANAIKFTPNGGRVEVAVEGGPEWIQVLVSDTGIGIDPAFLPRIFDRFAQAGDSITRGSGGLGLGLSIVRHIVELHEGTVSAASEGEGRGATFTVRLPVSPRRRQAGAVADIPAESGRSDPSSAHLAGLVVLVVDDDRDARDVLEMVLRRAAADVMSAASVREAVACVRERTPDVVVSDIGMPHEDGYSLIGKLRALGVAAPAIALTASVGADDERRAMEAGYQIHVPKPVTPARLLELVAAASRLHDQTS